LISTFRCCSSSPAATKTGELGDSSGYAWREDGKEGCEVVEAEVCVEDGTKVCVEDGTKVCVEDSTEVCVEHDTEVFVEESGTKGSDKGGKEGVQGVFAIDGTNRILHQCERCS